MPPRSESGTLLPPLEVTLRPALAATAAGGLLGLAWAAPAAATCPEPASPTTIASRLAEAEAAFQRLEVDAFQLASDQAMTALGCLAVPVAPGLAAHVHRVQGVRFFIDRQRDLAAAAFAAARHRDPDYRFPVALIPEGHTLRALYVEVPSETRSTSPAPEPDGERLFLDGVAEVERPEQWPVIAQVEGRDGTIRLSRYVLPGQPLPAYAAKASVGAGRPRRTSLWLSIGSGVALAAAGTAQLGARAAERRFHLDDPGYNQDDLDRLQRTANLASGSAWGLGAVGLGGLGAAVIVGAW